MFGKCIRNYISTLRYFFAVLGIIFLALLFGGSVLFNGTRGCIQDMTEQLAAVTNDADLSTDRVWNAIRHEIIEEFTGPLDDAEGGLTGKEAENHVVISVTQAVSDTVDNYADYLEQVGSIITGAIMSFIALCCIFTLIQIIGIILGRSFVLTLARSDVYSRFTLRLAFSRLIYDLFVMLSLIVFAVAMWYLPYLGLAFVVLYPLLHAAMSLVTSNLTLSKKKRIPIRRVLQVKNVLLLFSVALIEIIITGIIAYALTSLFNVFIGFYIMLALLVIASVSLTINSDSIILYLSEHSSRADSDEVDEDLIEVQDLDEEADSEELEE